MAKPPRSRPLAAFGLNVRKRRESLDLTQIEAAGRADLDPTYISGIERGVRNPSLMRIARGGERLSLIADTRIADTSLRSSACPSPTLFSARSVLL